jgi:hypothetical protein
MLLAGASVRIDVAMFMSVFAASRSCMTIFSASCLSFMFIPS